MQSGELSIFELYLHVCGDNFIDISQYLIFFIIKTKFRLSAKGSNLIVGCLLFVVKKEIASLFYAVFNY